MKGEIREREIPSRSSWLLLHHWLHLVLKTVYVCKEFMDECDIYSKDTNDYVDDDKQKG